MSTLERWRQWFDELAELDEPTRIQELDRRWPPKDPNRRHLEALLHADRDAAAAWEKSAGDLLQAPYTAPAHDPGTLVGSRWEDLHILEHLRSGGMADVYRAVLTREGVERTVALKVPRDGPDRSAAAALLRERETLARLHHPSIVGFMAAGSLPDGRPYLALEFVQGTPITRWSHAEERSRAERLHVFRGVLAAVAHAHDHLIVHRDLKPSNVLVHTDGTPKLLDFGVSRRLDGDRADGPTGRPADGHTPGYASPEQASGALPAAADDVHALGVLLRELLSESDRNNGHRPLPYEFACVVAKATAERRTDRYPSVHELVHDLERIEARLPVHAGGRSPVYAARCFLARHRWPLAAAMAVLATVSASALSAEVGRRRAVREAGRGWGAHAEAKRAVYTLESWLSEAATGTLPLEQLVRPDEATLHASLGHCPEALALVHAALARTAFAGGDRDAAGSHLAAFARIGEFPGRLGELQRLEAVARFVGVDPRTLRPMRLPSPARDAGSPTTR